MRSATSFVLQELKDSGLHLLKQTFGASHEIYKYQSKLGNVYYVKFNTGSDDVSNAMQAIIEVMAYRIYGLFNVNIPDDVKLVYKEGTDEIGIATQEVLSGDGPSYSNMQDLEKAFLPSVLIANWDLAQHNSINTDRGTYIIDPGGSFHFRARGQNKEYGDEPTELQTMRDPKNVAGRLFQDMDDDDLDRLMDEFANVPLSDILRAIDIVKMEGKKKVEKIKDSTKREALRRRLDVDVEEIKRTISSRYKNILRGT